MKKIEMTAEKMAGLLKTNTDLSSLAMQLNAQVDTVMLSFSGFGRSNLSRELTLLGKVLNGKPGEMMGPLTGNYGAYFVNIVDVIEAPAKEDFSFEKMQANQNFSSRVANTSYSALEKKAKIKDNRMLFY